MSRSAVQKPTGRLKDFLDLQKRDTRLLGSVEKYLLGAKEKSRSTMVLHPSEIVKQDWCHRASWFALSGHQVTKPKPSMRLQNVFDEGHAIHEKWQARFWQMGNLRGRWECGVCLAAWWGVSPRQCVNCMSRGKVITYCEVSLLSDDAYRISGHADGWITGIGDDTLIEIKSIGIGTIRFESPRIMAASEGSLDEAWKMIRSPFRSHLLQGAMYLELGAQMVDRGLFDSFPEEIVYLYELKSNQDVKEFVVHREPFVVEPMLSAAKEIVQAVVDGTPPPCNIDTASGCQACRQYAEVIT